MHYFEIVFLPSYEQLFSSFAVPAINDFILTIHLTVLFQHDVHCLLETLALQIFLDWVKILHYYLSGW